MGGTVGLCSSQPQSVLQNNQQIFVNAIKYYDSQIEPVTGQKVDVYSFKELFIHKKTFYFATKEQLQIAFTFMLVCARCPTGIQSIFNISSDKDYRCKTNYTLQIFTQHLNFSLKQHLDNLIVKGVSLNSKQILYILRQLVRASCYLIKKKLKIKSFDSSQIFLNSTYQIKLPLHNIINENGSMIQILQTNQMSEEHKQNKNKLYLAPQQMNFFLKDKQIQNFVEKNKQISKVFSLGILIMQCATMMDGAVTYYDYFGSKIDINKLNNDIKQLKNTKIAAVLSRMLQLDPRKRIKFKELQNLLSMFQQSMFQQFLLID